MDLLSIDTQWRGDSARVTIAGELDMSHALRVEQELRAVEQQRPKVVVLDLEELEFMDSTGLRLVLSAHARAERQGRRLAIIQGGDAVRRLFRLAGVSDRLDLLEVDAASSLG